GRRPRLLGILARAGPRDPGRAQMLECLEQRLGPAVERVVVRERDAVDAEVKQCLDRRGRGLKGEGLRCRLAPLGDAAPEAEDEEIGAARDVYQIGIDERLRPAAPESLRDAAAEHRVAGERDPHPNPYRPCRRTQCAPLIRRTWRSVPRRFWKSTTSSSPPCPFGCTSRPP